MQIFHIAEKSRWDAAKLAGSYAQSTYGRSLEDEGFIHASREDQWEEVRERYYADATGPLVLLVIDTDRLTSTWREDPVGETSYPHIYGPLNPGAVVEERPLPAPGPAQAPQQANPSFARLFLGEILTRMVAGVVVMGLVVGGYYVARSALGEDRAVWGLLAGAVIGIAIVLPLLRWRSKRLDAELADGRG